MTDLSSDTSAESTVTPTQLMWRVWAGVIVLPLLLTAVGLYADVSGVTPERNVDIAVSGTVGDKDGKIAENAPLPLRIEIHNGLGSPIRMTPLATKPVADQLEAQNLTITAVYRQVGPAAIASSSENLLKVAAQTGDATSKPASPSVIEIESQTSAFILANLRTWQIRGGWTPGSYEVQAEVSGMTVDSFSTMSVLSEPIRFEIVPAQ
ncbi:MAG: hypothetical protein O2820_26710 [Planctomycetota bacterium]|nr:hypothetical protein [Planctomycetota bacterium]MDA1252799.1 hypothetical protein [Planctomycetota bacterium]